MFLQIRPIQTIPHSNKVVVVMTDIDVVFNISLICSYLGPISYILRDKCSEGKTKNYWLLSCVVFSVLAWLMYISIMPELYRKKREFLQQQKLKSLQLLKQAQREKEMVKLAELNQSPSQEELVIDAEEVIEVEGVIEPN